MNKEENNYVEPTKVDINNAEMSKASDLLNRERTNIVSATIQANEAIDEKSAIEINNKIKVKKENKNLNHLIVFLCFVLSILFIFVVIKITKKVVEGPTVTTTTKASKNNYVAEYLNDLSKFRKFESTSKIIILLPENYDLKDNNLYYFMINKTDQEDNSYGTYKINKDTLIINDSEFQIAENGIKNEDNFYKMYDTEYKYYYNISNEEKSLLLINGTLKNELSLFLKSNKDETIIEINNYEETKEYIKLSNGIIFEKTNNDLNLNGDIYKLG